MNRGSNWPQYHATTAMLAPQYEYLVTERQQLDFYRF